jgi:hypothetical protein
MQRVIGSERQTIDHFQARLAVFPLPPQSSASPAFALENPQSSAQKAEHCENYYELLEHFQRELPVYFPSRLSKPVIRTAAARPRRIISPEQKDAPPTNRVTFDPTGFGNVRRLPGERERISRTAIARRPNSASTGRETCAYRVSGSSII